MAIRITCFIFLLVLLVCSSVTAGNYKSGWTEEHIHIANVGCVYAVLTPQIEGIKRRLNYTGDGIPPGWEAKFQMIKEEIQTMCNCIIEQAARKWSVQEFGRLTESERQEFVMEAFCSKKCTLAFNIPIDCGAYSSAGKKDWP